MEHRVADPPVQPSPMGEGEILWADIGTVHLGHGQDGIEVVNAAAGLDLDQAQGPTVANLGRIIGSRHTHPPRAPAPVAPGRVTERTRNLLCLFSVVQHRDYYAFHSGVECRHDGPILGLPRGAQERSAFAQGYRLHEGQQLRGAVDGRVLHVDNQPVEPGAAHHLSHERAPTPEERPPQWSFSSLDSFTDDRHLVLLVSVVGYEPMVMKGQDKTPRPGCPLDVGSRCVARYSLLLFRT